MKKQALGLLSYPVKQVLQIHCTGHSCDLFAVFEQGKGGDAADIKLCRQVLFCFGINLGYAIARFQLAGSLGKDWRHHLAGSAPGGPEVHQYGEIATPDMGRKASGIELYWLGGKQRLLTAATIAAVIKLFCRYTIDPVTMGTDYM